MKKVKSIMVILFLFVTVFNSISVYAGESNIKIYIDGVPLIADEPPISVKGRTLVPFRVVFEALNFSVKWESEAKQINAERKTSQNRIYCNIQIDSGRMIVMFDDYANGNSFVNDTSFEVPAQIINGKTYIPLRAISEGIGCEVDWNGNSRTITIASKGKVPTKKEVGDNLVIMPNITEETTEITTSEVTTETERQRDVVIYSDDNKPVVGETPGNILKDPNNPILFGADRYTEYYRLGSIGVCAWYAENRFYEVHGIHLYLYDLGKLRDSLTNALKYSDLKVITDVNAIAGNTIAVFVPQNSTDVGHMVYVEYVERNSNGNPINVYITETNGANTLNKNEFNPGYDGVIQKIKFDEFIKRSPNLELAGYIAANK